MCYMRDIQVGTNIELIVPGSHCPACKSSMGDISILGKFLGHFTEEVTNRVKHKFLTEPVVCQRCGHACNILIDDCDDFIIDLPITKEYDHALLC